MSLRLLILMPVIQLFVLGFALNKEVKNLNYGLVDWDHTVQSRDLGLHLSTLSHYIKPQMDDTIQPTPQSIMRAMQLRQIQAAVILPSQFSKKFQNHISSFNEGYGSHPPMVQILLNGEDANSAAIAGGYLSGMLQVWTQKELQSYLQKEGYPLKSLEPITVQTQWRFNPELHSAWYMIPGIAAILVTMVCSLLVAFSLVREKEKGTLEQLLVTPVGVWELLLSKTIPYLLVGFVELIVVLSLGHWVFGVPIRGDWFTLLFFNLVYMIPVLGLAILISTLVRTQQQALFLIWFCLIFFLLTGGFLLPWENMPYWLKVLTEGNPLRFFIIVLRESLLKGADLSQLYPEAVHLIVLGVLFYGAAWLGFRRRI